MKWIESVLLIVLINFLFNLNHHIVDLKMDLLLQNFENVPHSCSSLENKTHLYHSQSSCETATPSNGINPLHPRLHHYRDTCTSKVYTTSFSLSFSSLFFSPSKFLSFFLSFNHYRVKAQNRPISSADHQLQLIIAKCTQLTFLSNMFKFSPRLRKPW